MRYQVIVSFGKDKEYSYEFSQSDLDESSADEARRWFDKEFSELKCEPTNRVGNQTQSPTNLILIPIRYQDKFVFLLICRASSPDITINAKAPYIT